MRTILAATDDPDSADGTIDIAAALAQGCQARLVSFTAAIFDSRLALDTDFKAILDSERSTPREFIKNESYMLLKAAKSRHKKTRGADMETVSRIGDTATKTTIALVPEYDEPLIVVGRRGRDRISGLLLGSASQKPVTHATCPVLVVP